MRRRLAASAQPGGSQKFVNRSLDGPARHAAGPAVHPLPASLSLPAAREAMAGDGAMRRCGGRRLLGAAGHRVIVHRARRPAGARMRGRAAVSPVLPWPGPAPRGAAASAARHGRARMFGSIPVPVSDRRGGAVPRPRGRGGGAAAGRPFDLGRVRAVLHRARPGLLRGRGCRGRVRGDGGREDAHAGAGGGSGRRGGDHGGHGAGVSYRPAAAALPVRGGRQPGRRRDRGARLDPDGRRI